MIFLPGKHTFNVTANITSVTGFSMVGGSENTSTIVCSGLGCGGFCFDNVTGLNVTQLSFVSDSHSITTKDVYDFQLVNCTFANSSNTALIANNSDLLIEGNTFINNTGGTVQEMTFIPGGGIAVVYSNIILQGQNNFLNLTCAADICGGGAMYAENSTINFAGIASFINNTATSSPHSSFTGGGGGLFSFNTAINITGHVTFVNNSVSSAYTAGNTCEVGGGGASLVLCNATISGRVLLSNNMAEGESGCGGGLYLYESSVNTNGNMLPTNNSVTLAEIRESSIQISHTSYPHSFGDGNIYFFTHNHAGHSGGGIYMESGSMTIFELMLFTNNSAADCGGGISIGATKMTVFGNVSFVNNSVRTSGGGIFMVNSNVTMRDAVFADNYAGIQGGGLAAQEDNTIVLTGSVSFIKNVAGDTGGGIVLYESMIHITTEASLTKNIAHTLGGGISMYYSNMSICGSVSFTENLGNFSGGGIFMVSSNVTIRNAVFADNYAGKQGGGLAAQEDNTIILTGSVSFITNVAGDNGGGVLLIGSKMDITAETSLTNNSAHTFGGGISIYNGRMSVSGSVLLAHNYAAYDGGSYGGGLNVNIGTLNITGTMSLNNNSADHFGGGITIALSKMTVSGEVFFTGNIAPSGGAIYVQDSSPLVYCASDFGAEYVKEDCFFQISENASFGHELMVFEDNVAEAGSVLFGGSVDRCVLEGYPKAHSGQVFDMIANYSKQPDKLSIISSSPLHVCLCTSSQPCSATKTYSQIAYPGQTITIVVAALGQRNGTSPTTINAIIHSSGKSKLGMSEDRQHIDGTCTELDYTIFSSLRDIHLTLYVDTTCSLLNVSENFLSIPIHLLRCPAAFTLSRTTGGCICEKRLQKYTNSCNINNQTILRDGDFWVGYDNGLVLHPHCPFDYCQRKWINLTLNDTNQQCVYNRTGRLCGACPHDLSLALGSSRCLPCSNSYLSLLLPFAVMGLVLVLFMFTCRLTVALGTINGLVFYANIVGANQSAFYPSGSINFLRVFISWLNLDLGIETCFYDGMDAYIKAWLQFAFPIYIWGVIGLIIFISSRFPTVSRMFGSNPVAVLATLFLLSYAKILRAIISALSLTTLEYPHNKVQFVWLYDANITYLHGKHIPLFVIGILFLVLLFFPYTLLLLLGQWLQEFSHLKILSWMNNVKLKAFLDTYYAPYNEKHRYWTGLLLALRLVLLLVFAVKLNNSENLLAISAATFGLFWMVGSVYKNWYLGVLNASYIFNLGILAVATNYIHQVGGNQVVVTYISTGIAFITFLATVLGHIYFQTKEFPFWKKICCVKNEEHPDSQRNEPPAEELDSGNRPLIAPSTTYLSYGANKLREPLLAAQ